jgi:transposase-like protein
VDGYVTGTVECDNCLDEFQPKPYETRVKGGAYQRFNCPHCGQVFDVAFITTEGLHLRKQLKKYRSDRETYEMVRERYRTQVLRERPAV